MWEMTHPHVRYRHASFTCGFRLIHTWHEGTNLSHATLRSAIVMHMYMYKCIYTYIYVYLYICRQVMPHSIYSEVISHLHVQYGLFIYGHDSFTCVSWLIHVWHGHTNPSRATLRSAVVMASGSSWLVWCRAPIIALCAAAAAARTVGVCVRVYVFTYIYIYVSMYIHIYVWIYIYRYECI